jgi:signal transduction histidine kinase
LESNRSNRGIEVRVDAVATELALWVEPRTFERAVENVVRNALRYAVARVAVRVRVDGERLWIAVGDDGPGIPAEARERVLEPFTRLDPARGREHGGFGLGLAITRRIVERHGGEVRIGESELGGAEVRMSWPIARD